ncbi:MAG: ABC transporter permease [Actinobacteria bacterium]|nr:ABC transporter permease [Actinomycetota bacterium]
MINLLRAESIKLRTVTMNWVLGTIAIAFPLVVTLITAFVRGDDNDFTTDLLLEVLTGTSFITVLLVAVVAAASITSEFGFGTIRPTFAATPRRLRVITAKALVLVEFGLSVQLGVVLVGVLAGTAIAEGRGSTIDLADSPNAVPALVGTVVLAAIVSLIGLGVGLILRSTPAAVALLILWPLMAEGLIGGLLGLVFDSEEPARWMPFRAGFRIAQLNIIDDGPSRLMSGVYFGAVSLAMVALGSWLVNRRDA